MYSFSTNIWLTSIRQAFLQLLPYYIFIASIILIFQALTHLQWTDNGFFTTISSIAFLFSFTTPILISVFISYFLAKNFHLNRVALPLANLMVYVSFFWVFEAGSISLNNSKNFLMILSPLLCTLVYHFLDNHLKRVFRFDTLGEEVNQALHSIVPTLATIFIVIAFLQSVFALFASFPDSYFVIFTNNLTVEFKAYGRVFFSHVIRWATGVHGSQFLLSIFGETYLRELMSGNISAIFLINHFSIMGGAGASLSLVIAILLFSKNELMRKIAWISLPFSLFNISEVILFALPLILNIRFLIPFILVPVLNLWIACVYFAWFPVLTPVIESNWIQPIFLSGYAIEGNFLHILLQLFILAFGVMVYLPFMISHERRLKIVDPYKQLQRKLEIEEHLDQSLKYEFVNTQQVIIQQERDIRKLAREIEQGELMLYYQPKIDINQHNCYGLEALLRFKHPNGDIVGPYFLSAIEQSDLSILVDLWVIKQVKADCQQWLAEGFSPKISINISAISLGSEQVLTSLIQNLKEFDIEVEILEKTIAQDIDLMIKNIYILKNEGFKISIDDFGSGYSSLHYLAKIPADTIKLDRSFLHDITNNNSLALYSSICALCQKQAFNLVAEGVENSVELSVVKNSGVGIVQGFYFSKAIPPSEIPSYLALLKEEALQKNQPIL